MFCALAATYISLPFFFISSAEEYFDDVDEDERLMEDEGKKDAVGLENLPKGGQSNPTAKGKKGSYSNPAGFEKFLEGGHFIPSGFKNLKKGGPSDLAMSRALQLSGMAKPGVVGKQGFPSLPESRHPQQQMQGMHAANEYDQTLDDTCEGVSIVNVLRRITFSQCEEVCQAHGAQFFAPSSRTTGDCLEKVAGAEKGFWVNTIQVFPDWGKTVGSYLKNNMTGLVVQNYAAVVHRNMPNGIEPYQGLRRGKGVNCLYHLAGQFFGTRCDHGAQPKRCACKRRTTRMSCSDVQLLSSAGRLSSSNCVALCSSKGMRFFAPNNDRDLACLKHIPGTGRPTWLNLLQFFPISGSNSFSLLENVMSRKVVSSFDNRKDTTSKFTVTPHNAHSTGVAQNCVFYQQSAAGATPLYGTKCDSGFKPQQCACHVQSGHSPDVSVQPRHSPDVSGIVEDLF